MLDLVVAGSLVEAVFPEGADPSTFSRFRLTALGTQALECCEIWSAGTPVFSFPSDLQDVPKLVDADVYQLIRFLEANGWTSDSPITATCGACAFGFWGQGVLSNSKCVGSSAVLYLNPRLSRSWQRTHAHACARAPGLRIAVRGEKSWHQS